MDQHVGPSSQSDDLVGSLTGQDDQPVAEKSLSILDNVASKGLEKPRFLVSRVMTMAEK